MKFETWLIINCTLSISDFSSLFLLTKFTTGLRKTKTITIDWHTCHNPWDIAPALTCPNKPILWSIRVLFLSASTLTNSIPTSVSSDFSNLLWGQYSMSKFSKQSWRPLYLLNYIVICCKFVSSCAQRLLLNCKINILSNLWDKLW